ncbi:transient receptor potential cation channel protein painless-like isoform X2 [Periplaneta americana]|uniref:transient receptor potential cation channel protein painless-like isoform X2 n=1 Tax=Periplaneta americana TaxID=6978 RepID=UPI0037E7234D
MLRLHLRPERLRQVRQGIARHRHQPQPHQHIRQEARPPGRRVRQRRGAGSAAERPEGRREQRGRSGVDAAALRRQAAGRGARAQVRQGAAQASLRQRQQALHQRVRDGRHGAAPGGGRGQGRGPGGAAQGPEDQRERRGRGGEDGAALRGRQERQRRRARPDHSQQRVPAARSVTQNIRNNVSLLLGRADVDVNKRDAVGRTAMHLASQSNNYTALEVLLGHSRTDIGAADVYGRTVLHYEGGKSDRKFSRRQQIQKVLQLILDPRKRVNINKRDSEGKTAAHEAAEKGNLVVCAALLKESRTDVNIRDAHGRTILHCLAERHDTHPDRLESFENCISFLLDGPDFQNTVSTVVSRDETTRYRLDVDATDEKGQTALQKAALARNQHLILALLRRGASIRVNSSQGSLLDGIAASTFETFLDECIEDNKRSLHNIDYAIIFNYRFLSLSVGVPQTPETGPLLYMSQSKKLKRLLKHPVICTFIDLKWRRAQVFYYINIFLYTMFLIFLNLYVIYRVHTQDDECRNGSTVPNHIKVPLFIFLGYVLLREFFEFMVYPLEYMKSLENLMEIILICTTGAIFLFSLQGCQLMRTLFVIVLLISWLEWVLLTGRLPFLSIQVEMLKTVSATFIAFMAWYSFMIIAFAIVFFTIFYSPSAGDDNADQFPDLASAFFKTIIMMAGEFGTDSLKFDSAANIASHLVFVFFVVLIALVMLNLLNGLAVSDTQVITNEAHILSQISRIRSTFYIEKIALIDPESYNYVSKRLLCCFPFVNLRKLYNRISLFANISHEMRVFIFPNRKSYVSLTRPVKDGRHGVLQYKFLKIWRWSCIRLENKIVRYSLEIITRQKQTNEYPMKEVLEKLQEAEQYNKQRLDEIEERLIETVRHLLSVAEHRRLQTEA